MPGRVIVFILCIIGKIWVSLFTVILSDILKFTGGAEKSYDMLSQLEQRDLLSNITDSIMLNSTKLLILRRRKEKMIRENSGVDTTYTSQDTLKKIKKIDNEYEELKVELKRNIVSFNLAYM